MGIFGPYLTSSVSRAVYRMNRKSMKESPVPDDAMLDSAVTLSIIDETLFNDTAAMDAFNELPTRWRQVLWYLEIEAMHPREVAPIIGLSSNATVVLHRRAKEGLRLRYLQQQVAVTGAKSCQKFTADIPALTRGNLRQNRSLIVEKHLEGCLKCSEIRSDFEDTVALRSV